MQVHEWTVGEYASFYWHEWGKILAPLLVVVLAVLFVAWAFGRVRRGNRHSD